MEDEKKKVSCEFYRHEFDGNEYPKCNCFFRLDDGYNAGFCKRPDFYRCMIDVQHMPVPLSYSSAKSAQKCWMYYYLSVIRGIRILDSQMSAAVKMGKLWDCAKQKILGVDIDMNKVVSDYEIDNICIAKVRALSRAYKTLEICVEPGYDLQNRFDVEIEVGGIYKSTPIKVIIDGLYDRKYTDHFAEDKLSSKPDNYLDIYSIQSQVGAYFLADPAMDYCIMEVVRTPDLKLTGQYKEETPEAHENRTYLDIISRPAFYFNGFNREKKTYGKKFYRKEFNLDEIADRFRMISIHLHDCAGFDGWYKNDNQCIGAFGMCDMRPICRYNVMSETMYGIRQKKGEKS
jgi:hypothetical protein